MQQCCVKVFKKMKQARNTTAKTEIQELILSSKSALSHTEIQKQLIGLCDRVTIYRVLERLTDDGLIHKVVNVDGVVKYAGCHNCSEKHNHNHIHFSCQKCKSVTCLEDVEPSFKLPKNYKVSEVNFTLSGLCPQCA
jgi:Fur family ferric uptake transcriptional regulator